MNPRRTVLSLLLILACWGPSAEGAGEERDWDVAVEPVREVCVEGTGEGSWAAALLAPEGLAPALVDGRAQLSLCGTSARFGGRDFQEAIFSVVVQEPRGEAAFLVAALNSRRSYAWVERHRNRSPYQHGAVLGTFDGRGARLALGPEDAPWLSASTDLGGVAPAGAPEVFDGAIYLPGRALFYARLEGDAARAPWGPTDRLEVAPGASVITEAVLASGFTPTGWRLGAAARHAKTATIDLADKRP